MTTSRRQFLQTGSMAVVFVAVPLKGVLKAGWASYLSDDPLANYSKATFVSYINSIFQIQAVSGVVDTTLASVDDMPAPPAGECFSLLFIGGSDALEQNTYVIEHAALGTFQLFLVPAGSDANGAQKYVATINRVAA